jgi:hypothetical protein
MGPGITHVGRVDSVGALVVRRTPMAGAGVSVALPIFRWAGFSPVVRQTPIKKQSENLPQTTRSPFPPWAGIWKRFHMFRAEPLAGR